MVTNNKEYQINPVLKSKYCERQNSGLPQNCAVCEHNNVDYFKRCTMKNKGE